MASRSFIIPGFQFSGISAGIKEASHPDLALVVCERPAVVAATFTTNKVQAAPVLLSKKHIRSGFCQAIIINSGNANACTGQAGLRDAQRMARETARGLKIKEKHVLVCSTGKIGIPLPINRIIKKIPEAVHSLSPGGFLKSAKAILTTDASVKVASARGNLSGKSYSMAAFAKGAGMIEPHMATMLAFVMTDALVEPSVLRVLFRNCVEETFNRISVDGDTSTNDTAIVLSSGMAGNSPFQLKTRECREFAENLFNVMDSLARQMVEDGEGATKCVRLEVRGARNESDAKRIAYTIANSLLVKTSFFGADPNWGRLLAAAGRSGATLRPDRADIYYGKVCVARKGISTGSMQDKKAKQVLRQQNPTIRMDLHLGSSAFFLYTSDLTLDYVKINSCYRT